MNKDIKVIGFDDVPQGGFAGIVEKQMLLSSKVWPQTSHRNDISHGFKDFIYVAMGYFKPNNGAPIHPHKDVDIVTFIKSGKVGHEGTLGHGSIIESPGVQTQRAGTGMRHSEFGVVDQESHFIQMWFVPPSNGLTPAYKNFKIEGNQLTTVLGGENETLKNNMTCKIGFLEKGSELNLKGKAIVILFNGTAQLEELEIKEGDLVEVTDLYLVSTSEIGVVVIQET
ncbi:MAG: Pirin-like protein [Epsilonproteobacteria bacterium]|nr:MAG: Pirin-like protein [Campylobacterota bacterium]